MYYKIEDKDSKVYQELHALRTKELKIEEDNIKAIEEKTGMTWENSFGNHGQQTFRRVSSYQGFEFKETDKIDPKIWKQHKEHAELYVPNTRTKLGREMQEFLNNGLQGSRYDAVINILNLQELRRFTFPFVEIVDDLIIVFLGDDHEPKDQNVIEITKKEFQSLREELVIV